MKICEHIQKIINHEIKRNNKIKEISRGWSNVELVIDMKEKLDVEYIDTLIESGIKLKRWENNDNHYLLQIGYFCEACKQSIAGPK